jgi:hypothetical protein
MVINYGGRLKNHSALGEHSTALDLTVFPSCSSAARGYPKARIHEVGQRARARSIEGGQARANALTYEDDGFPIAYRNLLPFVPSIQGR